MLNQDPTTNTSAEVKTEEEKKVSGIEGYDKPDEVDYERQVAWGG